MLYDIVSISVQLTRPRNSFTRATVNNRQCRIRRRTLKHSRTRHQQPQRNPHRTRRRDASFVMLAGASAGASLFGALGVLGGCGGHDNSGSTRDAARRTGPDLGPVGRGDADHQLAARRRAVDVPEPRVPRHRLRRETLRRRRGGESVHRSVEVAAQHRRRPDATRPARSIRVPRFSPRSRPATRRAAAASWCRRARGIAPARSCCSRNVNFHLSANCTIYFSPNPADYAKDGPIDCGANGKLYYSRWQANDCLNYGSPVYARNQTNIALTGEGDTSVLNGQAMTPFAGTGNTSTCWWTFKGNSGAYGFAGSSTPSQAYSNPNNVDLRTAAPGISDALYAQLTDPATPWQQDQNYLPALSEAGVPIEKRIFGIGHYLRPCMVEFIGCTNVLMESYRTNNTPFWQHHPTDCTNVVIRSVTVDSIGPNNDGFDPDACDMVLCDSVVFNTGDDCIAIKSGKDLDNEYGPAQNHVIQNCTMNSGHGGITLGSEMGGGVQKIYARNLAMLNQFWATNSLNIAIRIKTNMNRGGFVKDFYVDNVTLPNGVSLTGAGYGSSLLRGQPDQRARVPLGVATAAAANPSAAQGGHHHVRLRLPAVEGRDPHASGARAERQHLEREGEQRDAERRDGLVLPGDRRARPGRVRLQRPGADARRFRRSPA